MTVRLPPAAARDSEAFAVHSSEGDWLIAWHSPAVAPVGRAHRNTKDTKDTRKG
jgi:hypothetical protein